MMSWLAQRSLRDRMLLVGWALMLPWAGVIAWLLSADLHEARDRAYAQAHVLASATASQLQLLLSEAEISLQSMAARPRVRALDPSQCDRASAEFAQIHPGILTVDVRDARGVIVCSSLTVPEGPMTDAQAQWFGKALHSGGFMASGVVKGHRTGRWAVVLSHPIRDRAGSPTGLVVMAVDLLSLNRELLSSVPASAAVTVADSSRTLLLRSVQPETYIGTRPAQGEPDPAGGRREGTLDTLGRDGVPRLFAFLTLPGTDWRVSASFPRDEVLAPYQARLRRAAVIAGLALLLTGALTLSLSKAIAGPIEQLGRAAARVGAGQADAVTLRGGPPELQTLSQQFNQMLRARRAAQDRLGLIFESAVDAIITTDETQTIVQVNPAAARMFRCPVDEMVGSPVGRFIPRELREQHRADMQHFGAGLRQARNMGAGREARAMRANGEEFPVESSISVVEADGQRLFTVIHRDATERVQAQNALLAGKAQLEAALASMNDAVYISDAQGHCVEFNDAFVRFHRFKDRSVCRPPVADCADVLEIASADGLPLPPDQWPVPRALRGDMGNNLEYRVRRRDTGESWIGSHSFAPIRDKSGAISGAVMVARDITALKDAQADLESSHAALQQLIAAQDRVQEEERARIARELHDDLQQTLAAIRMDLAQLGDRLAASAPALVSWVTDVDRLAAQAVVSTRRIVNDLRPPMLEDLGIVAAVQALAAQVSQRHGIACEVHGGDEVDEALLGNPPLVTCLYRLTQEALNNVTKHAGASRVDIAVTLEPGAQVRLVVADNGRGIQWQDRLKPGSNGLVGMQERVRAQGGRLAVDEAAGGGTQVVACLPLAPPDRPGESASAQGAATATRAPSSEAGLLQLLELGPAAPGGLPLPKVLSRAFRQALQSAIDAMDGNVAVLSPTGRLLLVNQGWVEFAAHNGGSGPAAVGPGADYLAVCRQAALTDDTARAVMAGLEDLVAGRRREFSCDYPCHVPGEQRWFRMRATAMASGELLVSHQPLADGPPEAPDNEPR